MPGNCVPARGRGEQPQARLTARNDSEAHLMSRENPQPTEPSLFKIGEGYQDWTKVNPAMSGRDLNDDLSSHRRGVVCGHGMSGQVVVLREEICAGGRQRPTAGASGNPARPVWPGQKSERLVIPMKRLITVEGRGLTWSK